MSTQQYPLQNRSQALTPPEGFQYLFRDIDNGGLLTAKNNDCSFNVISVSHVHDEHISKITDLTDQIVEDAGCAMKKGIITSEQYESIVDNMNVCLDFNIDPLTGSYQACVQNEPSLFISLVLTHVLCNGDSTGTATPTITGGEAPYTLDWDGENPAALAAGQHTLLVTDNNGKNKLVTFIITEPAALSATTSSTPETGGSGNGSATVVVSGGTAPYTYLWDDPIGQTTATATNLAAGNYNVTVTDANGCVLNVGPITVAAG